MIGIKPNLTKAATLVLRPSLHEKHLVILYDTSEIANDYVLLSEDPKDIAECALTDMHRLQMDLLLLQLAKYHSSNMLKNF